jgi:hypothetical protein
VQPDGACSVGGEHKKSQDPASPFCIKCGGRVFSLALPLGDAAADKFEGGGLGSSGVRR